MGRMRIVAVMALLASAAMGAPLGLSSDELEQVRTGTSDFSPMIDDAGIYPLLRNALTWTPGDEAGARVPDYGAIRAAPGEARGELFLIEGALVAEPRRVEGLSRRGAWEATLEQWTVQWGATPEDVAVVYLVSPRVRVRQGVRVRLPARFSRLWRTTDQLTKKSSDFMVFVGHSGTIEVSSLSPVKRSGGLGGGAAAIPMALVVIMGVGWFLMRRNLAGKPTRLQQRRRERMERSNGELDHGSDNGHEPLPEDPAAALNELERRREERT